MIKRYCDRCDIELVPDEPAFAWCRFKFGARDTNRDYELCNDCDSDLFEVLNSIPEAMET